MESNTFKCVTGDSYKKQLRKSKITMI